MEKEKLSILKKINKKILINCSLIFIVIISLITILTVSLYKTKQKKFNDETFISVKDHIKDNQLDWEYNRKENTFYCKRGPVVFKSESKLLNKHEEGQELIKRLVNLFYENVPWGPEIVYLREIRLMDLINPSDANGILFEFCAYGKRFGIKNNGIMIFLSTFLESFDQVNKKYLKNTNANEKHPFTNIINKIQYTLYQSYLKMQMKWFFDDYSTRIRNGGWHLRCQLNSINLRTEQIYKTRFNESQKTNWRYPFTSDQINHFDEKATKEITLKEIYENANNL